MKGNQIISILVKSALTQSGTDFFCTSFMSAVKISRTQQNVINPKILRTQTYVVSFFILMHIPFVMRDDDLLFLGMGLG